MNLINTKIDIGIRIDGFSDGQWATIATSRAKLSLEERQSDNIWERLEQGLDQFNDVVNHAYKEGTSGYVQLGNVSLNILDFRAIRVYYVQGGERVSLSEEDAVFDEL